MRRARISIHPLQGGVSDMKQETKVGRARRAFTLIELLIVVAIIAILALIAVPNFLEAQTRAKVSRAMTDMRSVHVAISAYEVDWNAVIWDANDPWTPIWQRYQPYNFSFENPGIVPDIRFFAGDIPWMQSFYCFAHFRPLTTPISYITYRPVDSFSKVVPFGLDTREVGGSIVYWVLLCAGPDKDDGDWYRGNNIQYTKSTEHPNGTAIKYDPTNGTVSNGDIWRGEAFSSQAYYWSEYVYPM
jgi:prepilin-type N-terminal cleavage/methylation domain-containing protein